jgi:uncharacterized protein (TIGR02001 family)
VHLSRKTTMVLSLLALAGGAWAQDKTAETAKAEPDYTLSYNVGVVTDYRYRGISQSRLRPALQGGADFAHKSGLYIGTWASTIHWIKDSGGKGNIEWDIYGGYKGTAGPVGYDVGVLRYQYPDNQLNPSANTTELYAAGTVGPATLKYSRSITNLFGFADSKGSGYLDLSATFDLGSGYSVVPHVGHQTVRHNTGFSYTDYSVTLGKDFGNGVSVSAAAVGTDVDHVHYLSPEGKRLGRTGLVLGAKYTF